MYSMATSMGSCVTDASTWMRPKRETSCSSVNSFGLNLCLDRRTHCLSPACKLLLPVPLRIDNGQR